MAFTTNAYSAFCFMDATSRRAMQRERVFRDRGNAFELHNEEFRRLFRLPKSMVIDLCNELRPFLKIQTRKSSLSVEIKVLTALRFYAVGCYQQQVGRDLNLCISQKAVSKCIREVSVAISNNLLNRWIVFPENPDEIRAIKRGFMDKFHFPGVLGVIDCTHISIVAPSTTTNGRIDESIFVNRKQFHSINVQMVCNSDMLLINVNSRYPGSTNDAFIWRHSRMKDTMREKFDDGSLQKAWLLGDTGYGLEPWLMTPIVNAEIGSPADRYNDLHKKTRSLIERVFGVFKAMWRCMSKERGLHYSPIMASHIINSCAVLYNMHIKRKLPLPHPVLEESVEGFSAHSLPLLPEDQRRGSEEASLGKRVQLQLLRKHFS